MAEKASSKSLHVLRGTKSGSGRRLPPWLKRPMPGVEMSQTCRVVSDSGVATVCEEARCPNMTECWSKRTATFMILGDRCTRRCLYCAVHTGRPLPPAEDEPVRLAEAVAKLNLRHVVITAVARDDLADEGAGHFAACVEAVRQRAGDVTIEVLPADFHARAECIERLCEAVPEVYNHNIETVERLTPQVRPQGDYRRSLDVIRMVNECRPAIRTKSGLMIGLGETTSEIEQTLADLRSVGCEVVTIGQYLQPSARHAAVERYYHPEEFGAIARTARNMGFTGVASAPLVRSSYNAADLYEGIA